MPADLEAIIASSVEAATADPADGADDAPPSEATDTDSSTDSPVVGETADVAIDSKDKPIEKAVEKPKEEAIDEFDKEHGIKPKRADGKENWMPYSRVRKIADNAVAKAKTAWAAAELAPATSKVADLEKRLDTVGKVEHIMFNEQARFIEILKGIPGYAELLTAAAKPATPAVDTQRPAPDVKNADGTVSYSPEGLQKLLDYERKVAKDEAVKEAEERLGKRFGPMEKQFAARQREEAVTAQLIPQIQAEMAEAETWPLFKENAMEILAALKANPDPKFNLAAAWRQVVFPKLTTDRTKMRAELMDELEKAPRGTSVAGSSSVARKSGKFVPDPNKATDLEDVIRASIEGLK